MRTMMMSSFSTKATTNLNDDNMVNHHNNLQRSDKSPQEWSTFHGKVSVLKEAAEEEGQGNKDKTSRAANTTPEWQQYGENRKFFRRASLASERVLDSGLLRISLRALFAEV